MTREQYEIALATEGVTALQIAYHTAQRIAWDMRYRADRRAVAREFLPRLTAELRERIEADKPAGGVV